MAALMMVLPCFTGISSVSGVIRIQSRNQASYRQHFLSVQPESVRLRLLLKMYVILKAKTALSFICADFIFSIP